MAALASVFVEVRPQTEKFEPDLKRKLKSVDGDRIGKEVGTRIGVGLHGAIGSAVSRSAKLFAVGFAAIEGVKVFSGFINDARESAKVSRITAQAIKSTGGAAKVTADQVGDLATAISNKTGADDEAIQSGQNLLLTFTNIRNGVGKGNDIFNQASTAIVDMTAALNNGAVTSDGLKSSSIQLGKALNDPVKGVTALQKVGVSFTASQKAQIKTLVDSGHTMAAQKIILRELGKEFGGAAQAASDPMVRLKTILGNLSEDIGGLLLPTVDKFANLLADTVVPGIHAMAAAFQEGDVTSTGFVGVMERIGVAGRKVADFVTGTIVPGFKALIASFKDPDVTSDGFVGKMEQLGVIARQVFDYIRGTAIPALVDFGKWVVRNQGWLVPLAAGIGAIVVAIKVWTVVTRTFAVVQAALNVVLSLNPIGILVLALVGLAVALVVAYKRSDTFRAIVQAAWRGIQAAASVAWNSFLKPIIGALVTAVTGTWKAFQTMATFIGKAWGGVKTATLTAIRFVVDKFLGMVGTILNGAAKAFGWVPGLGGKLKSAAAAFNKFRDQVNTALAGVKSRTVTVSANLTAQPINAGRSIKNSSLAYAAGGPVFGAGTATSDSIPAMLSNGEHVLTAREVKGFGGHGMVEQMRKEAVRGFAAGGPVGFDVAPRLSGMDRFEKAISAFNSRVDGLARKLAAAQATSPGLNGAVQFARSQAGKPYVWGAAGPGGYDCSGFISALVNVVQGRSPYSRRFSTGTLPAGLFAPGRGAFNIGWFTGNPGHVAATVNGVPMESRGGDGVVVGSRSRGASYPYFTHHGHLKGFAKGGPVLPGDPPFDVLDPRGRHYKPGLLAALQNVRTYDSGGDMPPGVGVWRNNTGRTETVTTGKTMDTVVAELQALRRSVDNQSTTVQLDSRPIARAVRTQATRDPGNGW